MAARAGRPLVVFVDDDHLNRKVFDSTVRGEFEVALFEEGASALEYIAQNAADIAVIASDNRMPGISGVELLEQARRLAPESHRMLISAYSEMAALMEAVNRAEIHRFFLKPWNREQLLEALREGARLFLLHRRLEQVEVQMRRSERLALIGSVTAGVAHELMNPVAYMAQNVQSLRLELEPVLAYLQDSTDLGKKVQASLEDLPSLVDDLEEGMGHLRRVADGIRRQASTDEGDPEPQDAGAVVELVTKLARPQLQGRVRMEVEGPPVKVSCGQTRLCQVLLNLVVNAGQAMREKGGLVRIRWAEEGERVVMSVSDTGPGIPEELHERIFEPTFTTKSADEGTGLGLPMVRELIERCGGKVTLESAEGAGTTFRFDLPRAS